jgi:uncharacterized protein (TIRG00374 family)
MTDRRGQGMSTKIISRKNQARSILFIAVLMAVTVAVVLKDYPMKELVQVIKSVHPFYLLAGIGLMFLFAGCQGMCFYMITDRLGQPAPYRHCIEYAYIGNYFGAITPGASGGQPAQLYYMNKDRIHVDISAITIFLMVFTSQIVILFLGTVLAILRYPMVARSDAWIKYLLVAGGIVMLGLAVFLSALMFMGKTVPYLIRLALKLGTRLRLIKQPETARAKLEEIVLSYREKSGIIRKHPDLLIKVFIVTVLQWTSYYMVTYLVYLGFGYRAYGPLELMTGQALISIAAAAVPLPGSVGIAEKAFLMEFDIFYTEGQLPSAMILSRIINFYLPLFISFAVYLCAHIRIMKRKKLL